MNNNKDKGRLMKLIGTKSKIESNLDSLMVEREVLRSEINSIKERKNEMIKKKFEESQKLNKLKISLYESKERLDTWLKHILQLNKNDKATKIQASMEGALNFFSEDSLQMELMKRTNNVREKRVEYTKVESEYNDLIRQIEEKKREKERLRIQKEKAEQQKALKEEERLRNLEDQRKLEEGAKKRAEFLQNFAPNLQLPFLSKLQHPAFNSREAGQVTDTLPKAFDKDSATPPRAKSSGISDFSFSQFLRWD